MGEDVTTYAMVDKQLELELTEGLGELSEGDFVGHIALMSAARHTATVRAVTQLSAYSLSRHDFQTIVRAHPGVALVLQMALGEAIHSLGRDIMKTTSRSQRVELLMELKKKFSDIKAKKVEAARIARERAMGRVDDQGRRRSSFGLLGHSTSIDMIDTERKKSWIPRKTLSKSFSMNSSFRSQNLVKEDPCNEDTEVESNDSPGKSRVIKMNAVKSVNVKSLSAGDVSDETKNTSKNFFGSLRIPP